MFLKRPFYIYIFLLIPLVFNLWWQYGEGNLFSSVFAGFCLGTLLNSWFFANFQDKASRYLHNQNMELMAHNHDLAHEILILKMPHLAKSMNSDSLG
jgi:hypothetical protein